MPKQSRKKTTEWRLTHPIINNLGKTAQFMKGYKQKITPTNVLEHFLMSRIEEDSRRRSRARVIAVKIDMKAKNNKRKSGGSGESMECTIEKLRESEFLQFSKTKIGTPQSEDARRSDYTFFICETPKKHFISFFLFSFGIFTGDGF